MLFRLSKYLMNGADGGSGSSPNPPAPITPGAPAAPAATPQAPAQGSPPAVDHAAIEAAKKQGRDAAFAELRRNGALKKQFLRQVDSAPPEGQQQQAAPSDASQLRRLDRALAKTNRTAGLSDKAYQRVEEAFTSEQPDDVDSWVKDYFEGFGVAQPASGSPAANTPNSPPPPVGATPHSDRGSPAPTKTNSNGTDILRMSGDDRAALVREKGLKWYATELRKQLRGVPVNIGKR